MKFFIYRPGLTECETHNSDVGWSLPFRESKTTWYCCSLTVQPWNTLWRINRYDYFFSWTWNLLTLSYTAYLIPVWHGGGSKVPEKIYAIKMIFLVIFWQIWQYNLDPMYIRGLHIDFEVQSIKNPKITAIFLAAVFLINLKIFSQRVLKTAVTRSILVLLRSGFLQTSYFL